MNRHLLAWGAALLCAAPAAAQQRPSPDSAVTRLDPIGVEVTRGVLPLDRSAMAVTVVDPAASLASRPAIGLDEALLTVPGVLVANRHNFALGSRIVIRGFGSRAAFGVRGVKLLVDGIPLTMPDGQAALTNLDLASAARVEVIRGAASSLYGNAAGGVIAIESALPTGRRWSVGARTLVGTQGTDRWTNLRKLEADASGGLPGGVGLAIGLSHLQLEGFRSHSSAEQSLANLRARVPLDATSHLSFVVNAVHAPVAQNPGSLPLDSADARPGMAWPNNVRTGSGEAADQIQAGVAYARQTRSGRLDVGVFGITRRLDNPLPFAYIDLDRSAGGARTTFRSEGDIGGVHLSWTAGIDVELQRDVRLEYENQGGRPGPGQRKDQLDGVTALGPFVRGQISLTPALDLAVGARYDRLHFSTEDRLLGDGDASGARTLSAVSPTVGAVLRLQPGLVLYGNAASSFQTPTTTELINAPPAQGEPCCPAGFNAALGPQRARSVEAGMRGRVGPLAFDLAAFHTRVSDELVPFQVEAAPGREFFRNIGRSRHNGLELGLAAALGSRLSASLAYTLNSLGIVEDGLAAKTYEGNRLPGVSRHRLAAAATLHAPGGVRLESDMVYQGGMFADDANTVPNPASLVLGARASLETHASVAPFIGIDNLLDTRYNSSVVINAFGGRYFEPAPGRSVYLGVRARLGPAH